MDYAKKLTISVLWVWVGLFVFIKTFLRPKNLIALVSRYGKWHPDRTSFFRL